MIEHLDRLCFFCLFLLHAWRFGGGLDGDSGKATQQMGLLWENFWVLGHFGALRVEVEFLSQACTTKTITTPAPAKPFPQIARGEEKLLHSDVLQGDDYAFMQAASVPRQMCPLSTISRMLASTLLRISLIIINVKSINHDHHCHLMSG